MFSADALFNCRAVGSDGEVGSIDDLYFDDEKWTLRYLVVDTGGWFSGRSAAYWGYPEPPFEAFPLVARTAHWKRPRACCAAYASHSSSFLTFRQCARL